jgi:hypothetical protein
MANRSPQKKNQGDFKSVDVYLKTRNIDEIYEAWRVFGELGFDSSDISYKDQSDLGKDEWF